mmetsp:Transcript_9991/g.33927  ORF Transcript_9991/g.33927 Transcript_9991/m.33927 type:complete len:136 (+) Transcript_9991:317-724(+)
MAVTQDVAPADLWEAYEQKQQLVVSMLETHQRLMQQLEQEQILLQGLRVSITQNCQTASAVTGKRKADGREAAVYRGVAGEDGEVGVVGLSDQVACLTEIAAALDALVRDPPPGGARAHAQELRRLTDLSKQLFL